MKLERYSKERRAGDQTSGGRGKLLHATTDLDGIDLVVRETLQNSWDARLEDWYPAYGVRVYACDQEKRAVLREQVFTDLPSSLSSLEEILSQPDLHVIEIFDRGTSGLDGPFHATRAAEDGEPNNFNSFVFDIGSTKASREAGGTYGFGKTATFEISRAHSVVYWSVCVNNQGQMEHRLIATSLHDEYAEQGARFTGAHWWGVYDDDEITPLRGEPAQELGEKLFKTHFGDEETGTSILIIDPEFTLSAESDGAAKKIRVTSDTQAHALMQRISNAIGKNAWPKTVTFDGNQPPMILQLFLNGVEQTTATDIQETYLPYVHSLEKVRVAQNQQHFELPPKNLLILKEEIIPITMRPDYTNYSREDYFGTRKDQTAGHLHLMLCMKDDAHERKVKNSLCLMRSNAELVVFYDPVDDLEDDSLEWFGVFKPTPECDHHFAVSEPPTHDAWSTTSTQSEVSNYVVSRALSTIKRRTRGFLKEYRTQAVKQEYSVRGLAVALRSFVPVGHVAEEQLPKDNSRRGRSTRKQARPQIEVLDATPLPRGAGQHITIRGTSPNKKNLSAELRIYASTPQGKMELETNEFTAEWSNNNTVLSRNSSAEIPADTRIEILLKTAVASALELNFVTSEIA